LWEGIGRVEYTLFVGIFLQVSVDGALLSFSYIF
jgi:hypothetical protein